jgi:hypothetical protein
MISQYGQESTMGVPMDMPEFKPVKAEEPASGYGGYFDPSEQTEQIGSYPVMQGPMQSS